MHNNNSAVVLHGSETSLGYFEGKIYIAST